MDRIVSRLKKKIGDLSVDNPRVAGEYAFALAMHYKENGQDEMAAIYGRESILLFDKCRMEELQQCASINIMIEGIQIPGLIHQGVVRNRLKPIEL